MTYPVLWAPGMSLISDTSNAHWVEIELAKASGRPTVSSLVPDVFEKYVRVLPPAYSPDGQRRHRWTEIAAYSGRQIDSNISFDVLSTGFEEFGRPADGGIDSIETDQLARVLEKYTATPGRVFYCVWEGLGVPEVEAWKPRKERVKVPDRSFHLLSGPLESASVFNSNLEWFCANLWWPADRRWFVATDIDGYSTYVGAEAVAIDALVGNADIDVVEVDANSALDPSYG